MSTETDAAVERVISTLNGLPGQIQQAVAPVVERLKHIGAQLDAAAGMGDVIVQRATERARDLNKKSEALANIVRETAKSIAG
jgi:LDH2 family malate/lactate/ureidoglycolate dehydrogenase